MKLEFKHSLYHVLYVTSSVPKIEKVLGNISVKYPALVIPYLSLLNKVAVENLENFEQYLYYPEGILPNVSELTDQLKRNCNIMDLGIVSRDSLIEMFANEINVSGLEIGSEAKIIAGEWKNLCVTVNSIKGDHAECSYDVFRDTRLITIPLSMLKASNKIEYSVKDNFVDYYQGALDKGHAKVILIDGYNTLFHHLYGYGNYFRSKDSMMIGGALGVYYVLLRLKKLYPDSMLHWVWDGAPVERFDCNKDYHYLYHPFTVNKERQVTFRYNCDWIDRFIKALGFRVHRIPEVSVGNVMYKLRDLYIDDKGYDEILIYSTDYLLGQLVTNNKVKFFRPKIISRGYAKVMEGSEVFKEFKVDRHDKIVWVSVFSGLGMDIIPSAFSWLMSNGYKTPTGKYLGVVRSVAQDFNTVSGFLEGLRIRQPVLSPFIEGQFWSNFNKIRLICNENLDLLYEINPYDEDSVRRLLEELGNYKELESFARISLQFQGLST